MNLAINSKFPYHYGKCLISGRTNTVHYVEDTDGNTGKVEGGVLRKNWYSGYYFGETVTVDRRRYFDKKTSTEELRQYKLTTASEWPDDKLRHTLENK